MKESVSASIQAEVVLLKEVRQTEGKKQLNRVAKSFPNIKSTIFKFKSYCRRKAHLYIRGNGGSDESSSESAWSEVNGPGSLKSTPHLKINQFFSISYIHNF
jgi:hypothetical protein